MQRRLGPYAANLMFPIQNPQARWAAGPGRVGVERVYTRSAGLDGEAVVVFMRALCAVSQEELDAPGGPRCGSVGVEGRFDGIGAQAAPRQPGGAGRARQAQGCFCGGRGLALKVGHGDEELSCCYA